MLWACRLLTATKRWVPHLVEVKLMLKQKLFWFRPCVFVLAGSSAQHKAAVTERTQYGGGETGHTSFVHKKRSGLSKISYFLLQMCIPLILQNKLPMAESYVMGHNHLEQQLVTLLDSWCHPNFIVEDICKYGACVYTLVHSVCV